MKENIHFTQYAIIINLFLLISGLAGFLTAWLLFCLTQEYKKRPGINIKEF